MHALRRAWRVRIFYEGKQRHVGRFKDDVAAARAYDKAAVYLYGSKAVLNFTMAECLADPSEVSAFIAIAKELSDGASGAGSAAEQAQTAPPRAAYQLQQSAPLYPVQQNSSTQYSWSPTASSAQQQLITQQFSSISSSPNCCQPLQQQHIQLQQQMAASGPSYSPSLYCPAAAPQLQTLTPKPIAAASSSSQYMQLQMPASHLSQQPGPTCYRVPVMANLQQQQQLLQMPLASARQQQLSNLAVAGTAGDAAQLLVQQQALHNLLQQQQYAGAAAAPATAVGGSAPMHHSGSSLDLLLGGSSNCSTASSSAYAVSPALPMHQLQQQQQIQQHPGLAYMSNASSSNSGMQAANLAISMQPSNFGYSQVSLGNVLPASCADVGPVTVGAGSSVLAARQQQFYGPPAGSAADVLADLLQGCSVSSSTPMQYCSW